MKKFFILGLSLAAVALIFFAKFGMNFSVVRENFIHSALINFITPSEKFWVHRCNSLEKASEMSKKFSGIEIDANFYPAEQPGRKFDISHDRHESVEFPLENFLPILAETNTKIWFDFKNLSHDNAQDSLLELENLLEKYHIDKSRLIVENHNFMDLKIFHDAGFYTSYYVTVKKEIFDNEANKENFRAEVRTAANSSFVDAVSFPLEYYELVKSANVSVDYLTWNTHDERWWTFYRKSDLREMLEDNQVKVILIKFITNFDRF